MEVNPVLRVSTMTYISNLNTEIDLKRLFDAVDIDEDLKYIEYGALNQKGQKSSKSSNSRKTQKKFFYNQITAHIFEGKIVNVKIFNNGKIQMTGIKNEEQGIKTLNKVVSKLKNLDKDLLENILTNQDLILEKGKIAMINTDFDCGFKVKREVLQRLVTDKGYYSSFEPTIYPGVNIKYYFNKDKQNTGICNCEGKCNGKGKDGFCKKITVAVFNSGKIIITGGQSYEQLNTAYDFIHNILEKNKKELILEENKAPILDPIK
jgi:TATA-box binding protein (TBP) (component of TFIID and TFIIIB)